MRKRPIAAVVMHAVVNTAVFCCRREDPSDAVVMKEEHRGKILHCLPAGSIVGEWGPRRSPELEMSEALSTRTTSDSGGDEGTAVCYQAPLP